MIPFLGKKNQAQPEYMAGILFKHDEGTVFVYKIQPDSKVITCIDTRPFKFTHGWESLVYDIDEVLFAIENERELTLKKAVFFVYSHLIDTKTGELKDVYLKGLEAVKSENGLEAEGYIELDELLSRHYAQQNQSLVNAVFVEIDTPAVSAFVYQGGKRVFAESVAKTQDLVADLDEIFGHIDSSAMKLPARIIMYDSTDLQSESHLILTHKWPESLFIQLPKVDIVKESDLSHALEMGLASSLFGEKAHVNTQVISESTESEDVPYEEVNAQPEPVKKAHEQISTTANLGFVIGQDVSLQQEEDEGFYPKHDEGAQYEFHHSQASEYAVPATTPSVAPMTPDWKMKLKNTMISLQSMIRFPAGGIKTGIIGLFLILIVGGALVALMYFNHTARLTVLYTPQILEKNLTYTNDLQIRENKDSFTVSSSIATTGSKDIGEKAKGEITIYNADEKEKTFKKGSKLASGDLNFILDDDVTVSAATKTITGDGDILTSTSKKQANVTADEIGPDSNIKKDTKLSFDGLSDTTYFAKATSSFTGGTAKKIQTASKEDIAKLDKDLEKKINEKSEEKLQQAASSERVLQSLTVIKRTKEKYSKELAEEAKTIDATVTADVMYYTYDDAYVRSEIAKKLSGDIPDGYVLHQDGVTYSIKSAKKDAKTGKTTIEIEATGKPVLKLDSETLKTELKGSPISEIGPILKGKYAASGFDIEVSTFVPLLNKWMPFFQKNITIELKPDGS